MSRRELPSPEEIDAIHDEIVDEYDLTHAGARRDPERWLRKIVSEASGYEGIYSRAAVLLRKLIVVHVYEDGNKRTAWLATVVYLDSHGREPAASGEDVERFLKRIKRFDIPEIAEWLETGEVDESRLI